MVRVPHLEDQRVFCDFECANNYQADKKNSTTQFIDGSPLARKGHNGRRNPENKEGVTEIEGEDVEASTQD